MQVEAERSNLLRTPGSLDVEKIGKLLDLWGIGINSP